MIRREGGQRRLGFNLRTGGDLGGTAILGLLPMLFGIGGSELERPLAIVLAGGLATSTHFTLLALPSVYALVGRARAAAPTL